MTDSVPAAPEIIDAVRRGAPVWLAGKEYVPKVAGLRDFTAPAPTSFAPVQWQFSPDQPAEVVVSLSARVVYRIVGADPFPTLQGLHRRFVRAALQEALARLDASEAPGA